MYIRIATDQEWNLMVHCVNRAKPSSEDIENAIAAISPEAMNFSVMEQQNIIISLLKKSVFRLF